MKVEDAFHHLLSRYPGGAHSLAPRLGKAGGTLCHEVRPPAASSAKLGLRTALDMMALSGDYGPLHVMCAELGHMAVPLPVVDDDGDDDMQALTARLADVAREFAEVMAASAAALADRRVTDNELAHVERQFSELVATGQVMMGQFARMNAKLHPLAFPPVAQR